VFCFVLTIYKSKTLCVVINIRLHRYNVVLVTMLASVSLTANLTLERHIGLLFLVNRLATLKIKPSV